MPRGLLLLLVLPVSLGGCVINFAPAMVEAVRETAGQGKRFSDEGFAPAAEEACRARAARHGRVQITTVEPHGEGAMRVYGTIDRFAGSPGRSFACVVRRDGILRYFKVS